MIKNNIRDIPFFDKLSDLQLDILVNISSIDTFPNKYIYCYENEKSKKLVFLIKGLARAYKIDKYQNEVFLYYIKNGDILSEISSFDNDELTTYSNISFVEESIVLICDYKLFKKKFIHTNILTKEFICAIMQKSKNLEYLINREFIFNAVTKVAIMIKSDLSMFNKLKRHNIALILHIQPATLSRVLKKLKRDNIIKTDHGYISIVNQEKLKYIAEGF
jgi:CRP/FNR family transcriptional regulator